MVLLLLFTVAPRIKRIIAQAARIELTSDLPDALTRHIYQRHLLGITDLGSIASLMAQLHFTSLH